MRRPQFDLTAEGLTNLQIELDDLKTNSRRDVANRIHRASEHGGIVDNAEYDEVKNEQSFIEGRIQELEFMISNAVVKSRSIKSGGIVEFGSSVTIITQDGQQRKYRVVGSAEAAPLEGKISNESPVGKSLIGHKRGDEVQVETPAGIMKMTIKNVN